MTKKIQKLVVEAIEAIQAVHGDTSGDLDNNIEAMTELRDECATLLDALEGDKVRLP